MGIENLLKSMLNLPRAGASDMGSFPGVPVPEFAADPSAVAEFSKMMAQGLNRESHIDGVTAPQSPDAVPGQNRVQIHDRLDEAASVSPMTLGERLGSARVGQAEHSGTKQWLNTVTDIFEKDAISYSDLYRVQVLAGMAQIEITRNSSINKSMDEGLKTLLKNT